MKKSSGSVLGDWNVAYKLFSEFLLLGLHQAMAQWAGRVQKYRPLLCKGEPTQMSSRAPWVFSSHAKSEGVEQAGFTLETDRDCPLGSSCPAMLRGTEPRVATSSFQEKLGNLIFHKAS